MDMYLDKAMEFILTSKLDYASLTKTDEYKIINTNSLYKSFTNMMYTMKLGLGILLKGDLYKIIFDGVDDIKLLILYKVEGVQYYYATVFVNDESLKRRIRENAKTMKGVELKVKCINGGIDYFELVDIYNLDEQCNFGRYICTDCGYDYGFEVTNGCCICEGKVKKIYDFYA